MKKGDRTKAVGSGEEKNRESMSPKSEEVGEDPQACSLQPLVSLSRHNPRNIVVHHKNNQCQDDKKSKAEGQFSCAYAGGTP
jgi:hypothetical protein